MTGEPSDDDRRFVCSVVVQHQMYLADIRRHRRIHRPHELQELLMAVTAMAFVDHLARRNIECSEKRGRAVSFVIAGPLLRHLRGAAESVVSFPAPAPVTFPLHTAQWRDPPGSGTALRCHAPFLPA